MSPQSNNPVLTSSNQYYRAGALDTKRWAKIAEVPDYKALISAFDWHAALNRSGKSELAILDCGCGPGHFPHQLQIAGIIPENMVIHYDTVDPSSYSLTEHRKGLSEPFLPRHSYNFSVQQIAGQQLSPPYDVIWCIHSLYTVLAEDASFVLDALRQLLAPDGQCFIYLPTRRSSYNELFDLYQSHTNAEAPLSYLTVEDVTAALPSQGIQGVVSTPCSFAHEIPTTEPETLATYLNQISLRPDLLTGEQWQSDPVFASTLIEAFDPALDVWRFQQHMRLISFSAA